MNVGSVSNSTDGASATALLSPLQHGHTGFVVQAPVHGRICDTSHDKCGHVSLPALSLEAFAALDSFDSEVSRWSPAQALGLRSAGQIGLAPEWPTLLNYLGAPGFMQDAPHSQLSAKAHRLPKPHAPITVYGMPSGHKPTLYEVVMPGSYVALSRSLARLMAMLPPNVPTYMHSTKVYADELVYQGDAYGFVYVPRSLQLGFERYQADLQRVLGEASTQRVPRRAHSRGASAQSRVLHN